MLGPDHSCTPVKKNPNNWGGAIHSSNTLKIQHLGRSLSICPECFQVECLKGAHDFKASWQGQTHTCEIRGMMVFPAWPPMTGTLTRAGSKPYHQSVKLDQFLTSSLSITTPINPPINPKAPIYWKNPQNSKQRHQKRDGLQLSLALSWPHPMV